METEYNTPETGEKSASLEEMFGELDDILARMEDGELTLEQSFALYEQGMKKIRQCNTKLDQVEKQMLVLTKEGTLEPFGDENE